MKKVKLKDIANIHMGLVLSRAGAKKLELIKQNLIVAVANMPFSQDKWAEGFNPGGENNGNSKNKDKKFKMEAKLDPYNRFGWGASFK